MALLIELPQVGESVVEGTIGKWLKQPGDTIQRYDPLVEVVTDKVTMDLPSPVAGTLLRILAQEGDVVPMGAPIAEVETDEAPAAPPSEPSPAPEPVAAPAPSAPAAPANPGTTGYLIRDQRPVGPTGGGPGGQPPGSDVSDNSSAPAAAEPARLSPAVRRLAQEHDVDLSRVAGTGMGGRITRQDVEAHLESRASVAAQAVAAPTAPAPEPPSPLGQVSSIGDESGERLAPEPPSPLGQVSSIGDESGERLAPEPPSPLGQVSSIGDESGERLAPEPPSPLGQVSSIGGESGERLEGKDGEDEERIPLTPVRRMIAEAMVRSVTQIPHAWSTVEVDVTNLVAVRSGLRGTFQQREGVEITYLPFVIKMVVEALRENPTLNATWGGDAVILKKRVNMGIAVAGPEGLIVPVIHDAQRQSIAGLAHSVSDLTARARSRRLTLGDVQGGTFTLNNTGVLGSIVSQPIINPPQAGILTTEAIQKRPVVINDAIAIRSMMNVCLSFDHRINDGAESSAFLQSVKRRLEAIDADTPIY